MDKKSDFFFSSRRRHTRWTGDWSSDVCSSDLGAGYNSAGRFYEEADQLLGMTPTRYRSGGAGTEIQFAIGQCSLGSILVARSARGLCSIMMGDDPAALAHELHDRFPKAQLIGGDAKFERWVAQVVGLVEHRSEER